MQSVSEIKEINLKLEKYSFAIAHDLKSPLNTISGLRNVILERNKNEISDEAAFYVQKIYNSSLALSEFVNSLLQITAVNSKNISKT